MLVVEKTNHQATHS